MDHAKKAANKGLYALSEDSADSISDLGESKVDWKTPSAPQQQAIGAEDSGGYKFNNHSGQALAADITCRCPSAGHTNECIKIQSGGNVITSAVTDKQTTSRRGEHSKNTALPACGVKQRKDQSSQASRTSGPC
ncbi:hypothetical protein ERJ75_001564800 [Trypanosoma vivax]|nr:hypothetical protein ERJ75_001564800 [Trypanosoma vivax]